MLLRHFLTTKVASNQQNLQKEYVSILLFNFAWIFPAFQMF